MFLEEKSSQIFRVKCSDATGKNIPKSLKFKTHLRGMCYI